MNCKHIESLLSRYVEDDVSAEERGKVESHVADCPACSESLVAYQQLEVSLVARRDRRPDAGSTIAAVFGRVSFAKERPWWAGVLRPIPMPAVLSTAFIAAGVILFMVRASVAQWVSGALPAEGSADALARFLESLGDTVVSFAGANQLVVMALYFGVFGLIFFTGSVMVFRFVRE